MGDSKGRRSVVGAFRHACESADGAGLAAILTPNVSALTDGGKQVTAGTQSVRGAEAVMRLILTAVAQSDVVMSEQDINGQSGLVLRRNGHVVGIICLKVRGARVCEVWIVLSPERLRSWNRA
jgi:RNA polymerase sigma-70 factor, ECF subfamily